MIVKPKNYIKISLSLSAQVADILSEVLLENEALSVSLEDAADTEIFQLQPNEQPLWPTVQLTALFPSEIKHEKILHMLQLFLGNKPAVKWEALEEQDWVRLTQQHFKPLKFGKDLWICPSWHDEQALVGKVINIDPGVAFGTGTHATTSLCLEWLAENPPINKSVIDYGCGSGILALAALVLGAEKVYAVDHDAQALEATIINAARNNFSAPQIQTFQPQDLPALKADLIVANILAAPLLELAETFSYLLKPGGTLILSGILIEQEAEIIKSYQRLFNYKESKSKDDWLRMSFLGIANVKNFS